MDKTTATLASLAVLCVTLIVIVFTCKTGFNAEKVALSAITGILGLVSGGSVGYTIGRRRSDGNNRNYGTSNTATGS